MLRILILAFYVIIFYIKNILNTSVNDCKIKIKFILHSWSQKNNVFMFVLSELFVGSEAID